MTSMKAWLTKLRPLLPMLELERDRALWVVLGNEAMDVDSQSSSLVVAYFLQRKFGPETDVIPVLNVPKREFHLRRDNVLLLEKAEVKVDDLIFIDEIPLKKWLLSKNIKVALCDHNELSPRQKFIEPHVGFVLDHHHQDDSLKWKGVEQRVKMYASCCSLAVEHITENDPNLLQDEVVRQFLGAAILIDSSNFASHNTQEEDKVAFKNLLSRYENPKKATVEFKRLLEELSEQRVNLDGFTPAEIIFKDLKYCVDKNQKYLFAVSSVKAKIRALGLKVRDDRLQFMTYLTQILLEKQTDSDFSNTSAFFILAGKRGPYKRLVSVVRKDQFPKDVAALIQQWLTLKKQYLDITVSGRREILDYFKAEELGPEIVNIFDFAIFELDAPVSRKQVLPFLTDVLSSI